MSRDLSRVVRCELHPLLASAKASRIARGEGASSEHPVAPDGWDGWDSSHADEAIAPEEAAQGQSGGASGKRSWSEMMAMLREGKAGLPPPGQVWGGQWSTGSSGP